MIHDLHFSISTGCFYRQPIADVLHWFAEFGFTDLEICSFPAHLDFHDPQKVRLARQKIEESGLRALSFHAPFADQIDIASWEEPVRRRSVEELLWACDAAKELGSKVKVVSMPCWELFRDQPASYKERERLLQKQCPIRYVFCYRLHDSVVWVINYQS